MSNRENISLLEKKNVTPLLAVNAGFFVDLFVSQRSVNIEKISFSSIERKSIIHTFENLVLETDKSDSNRSN